MTQPEIKWILEDGIKWQLCLIPHRDSHECDYKAKKISRVKRHRADIHDIEVKWHYCVEEVADGTTCDYKSKHACHLRRHLADCHEINVKWYACGVKLPNGTVCDYKAKSNGNLSVHLTHTHLINVTWYVCEEKLPDGTFCDHKAKSNGSLKAHLSQVHEINVTWYSCSKKLPNGMLCDYKAKFNSTIRRHHADVHGINVTWYPCTENLSDGTRCDHKAKHNTDLIEHLVNRHEINVTWYPCTEDLSDGTKCDYKPKQKRALTRHLSNVHDIGNHECEICRRNHNSHIPYTPQDKPSTDNPLKEETLHICRQCYNKVTGKTSRVEKTWSEYIDKNLGTVGLVSSDKSLKSVGGCQLYRPDKLYIGLNVVELDECDERQHLFHSASYLCDEKRLSDIYGETGICGKTMFVIRWNPDHYIPPKSEDRKKRLYRLELMVKLKQYLRAQVHLEPGIHVIYMFYSLDNPLLCQNLKRTMVYSEADFSKIFKSPPGHVKLILPPSMKRSKKL